MVMMMMMKEGLIDGEGLVTMQEDEEDVVVIGRFLLLLGNR